MKFFLTFKPPTATAQERKIMVVNNKPLFYMPTKLKEARRKLKIHLRPFIPEDVLLGPLELRVIWLFPKGRHKHMEWRTTRPDTDNLEKMLKDVMTELGFWQDDSQVVVEHVEKVWSKEPVGIEIEINQLSKLKEETNNG